jgi:hypothetical protein
VSDDFGIGVIVGIVLTMLCCLAGIGISVLFPRRDTLSQEVSQEGEH